ncbi:hypothetical protein HPP92_010552 [Vanilla planifolia]|uniref:Uncharacterized protein n=1 Tax=Vanilla planifolia TaxID=51239 RepID=A0A835UXN6_VANPL|nr:hypothetical protein HPP92_010552 [Vanilla planifolia]
MFWRTARRFADLRPATFSNVGAGVANPASPATTTWQGKRNGKVILKRLITSSATLIWYGPPAGRRHRHPHQNSLGPCPDSFRAWRRRESGGVPSRFLNVWVTHLNFHHGQQVTVRTNSGFQALLSFELSSLRLGRTEHRTSGSLRQYLHNKAARRRRFC